MFIKDPLLVTFAQCNCLRIRPGREKRRFRKFCRNFKACELPKQGRGTKTVSRHFVFDFIYFLFFIFYPRSRGKSSRSLSLPSTHKSLYYITLFYPTVTLRSLLSRCRSLASTMAGVVFRCNENPRGRRVCW